MNMPFIGVFDIVIVLHKPSLCVLIYCQSQQLVISMFYNVFMLCINLLLVRSTLRSDFFSLLLMRYTLICITIAFDYRIASAFQVRLTLLSYCTSLLSVRFTLFEYEFSLLLVRSIMLSYCNSPLLSYCISILSLRFRIASAFYLFA